MNYYTKEFSNNKFLCLIIGIKILQLSGKTAKNKKFTQKRFI